MKNMELIREDEEQQFKGLQEDWMCVDSAYS